MLWVWISLGVIIGIWAGWQTAQAQTANWLAKGWEELSRRLVAGHGSITHQDVLDIFGTDAYKRTLKKEKK